MKKENIIEYLNDWNFWALKIDCGIERGDYVQDILKGSKTKEVIVLSGIRRCGKSTILLQVINDLIKHTDPKNTLIINLEDPRVIGITVQDLMQIYDTYLEILEPEQEHYLILDEVQNVQRWESFVRYLHDNKKITVLVTGSNSHLLDSEFSSTLSGRYLTYVVFPLSLKEFLDFKDVTVENKHDLVAKKRIIEKYFKEYLLFGGFPKVALTDDLTEKRKMLSSYYETILIKDIALRHNIKETGKLQELAKYYFTNISKIVSQNKIKTILGLSLDSVQRFSDFLEKSYLIYFLPKFDFSYNKQILNPKKVYCADLGLQNAVSFKFSEDRGRLLENAVFLHLKKRGSQLYYYKTKDNLEIDFAIKEGNRIKQLIQVADNLEETSTKDREINALTIALKENKLKEGLLLVRDGEETINAKGVKIKIMPVWKWLLQG